jgi:hypothetical protein
MRELLAALDRARRPKRWPWIAAGTFAAVAAIVGGSFLLANRSHTTQDPCAGSPQRVAAIWGDRRKATLATAFHELKSDEVWTQLRTLVDRYTSSWAIHHRDICRATHVRHDQSSELHDLRMRCMESRLADLDALLERLPATKRETVFKSIDAVAALPDFSDCDDSARLRAAIPLPQDPATRAKIAEMERSFSEAVAYDRTGDAAKAKTIVDPLVPKAKELGYAPLEAKLVMLRAGLELRAGDLDAAAATYRESAEIAARARDDVRIAQSWIDLMNVLGLSGKHADALALETVARTATQSVDDEAGLVARFAYQLGGIYRAAGK